MVALRSQGNWRSEKILRMTPHEEHPQGRPRIKSLDKDSFYFEQGGQEKNEEREIMALLRKGCSRDWREVLCAWERRGREVEKLINLQIFPYYTAFRIALFNKQGRNG